MRQLAITLPTLVILAASSVAPPSRAGGGVPAGATSAVAPVAVGDLLRLVEAGAGETLLSRLIQDRGVRPPVEVADLVALKRAGLSDALAAEVLASARGASARSISYREEDGVLVVEGRGEPAEATSAPAPPPTVVVVDHHGDERAEHAELAGHHSPGEPAEPANPYPVGATFGLSGGAVFLPAHFGDPPSSFGRTIVLPSAVAPYPAGWWGHPQSPSPGFFPAQPGQGAPWAPAGVDRSLIPIRTSRGIRFVPN